MPASIKLYRQWSKPIVGRFVSHPSSSGANAWEKLSDAKPETDLPIHGSEGKRNVGGRRRETEKKEKVGVKGKQGGVGGGGFPKEKLVTTTLTAMDGQEEF